MARERLAALRQRLAETIVGQEAVVQGAIIGILAGGHVLLEGAPGLGKTLLVRSLAHALELEFARIQFTPDLMPGDITGTQVVDQSEGRISLRFERGPVFCQVLLADEINRATPKTQSALLEAMQERRVTIGRESHVLEAPFFVLATQNPLEMEGTYPLPEAQLDRFLLKIDVPFPTRQELLRVLALDAGHDSLRSGQPVLTRESLLELQELCRSVIVAPEVAAYAADLVIATHPDQDSAPPLVRDAVRSGVSPRGAMALLAAARARAICEGRPHATFEDVAVLAPAALAHRLLLRFGYDDDPGATGVVAAVLEAVAHAGRA